MAPYFYMLRGESMFAQWKQGKSVDAITSLRTSAGSVNYTVQQQQVEDLYFIWEAQSKGGNVYAAFSLQLMLYDSRNWVVATCAGLCEYNLDSRFAQVVLVNAYDTGEANDVQTITYTVTPRAMPFVGVGSAVVGVLLAFSIVYFVRARVAIQEMKETAAAAAAAAETAETIPEIRFEPYPPLRVHCHAPFQSHSFSTLAR
jgi:hypothetical protein